MINTNFSNNMTDVRPVNTNKPTFSDRFKSYCEKKKLREKMIKFKIAAKYFFLTINAFISTILNLIVKLAIITIAVAVVYSLMKTDANVSQFVNNIFENMRTWFSWIR